MVGQRVLSALIVVEGVIVNLEVARRATTVQGERGIYRRP